MGIFKKIGNFILGSMLEQGITQGAAEYAASDNEFDLDIMPCFDEGYATPHLQQFFNDLGSSQVEINSYPVCNEFKFTFEDYYFVATSFRHYARTVNVSMPIRTGETSFDRALNFCNEVNKIDMAHQVAPRMMAQDSHVWIVIHQMFIFTPMLGNVDDFKVGLRQMITFGQKLTNEMSIGYTGSVDFWKLFAPEKKTGPNGEYIKTAEEVLFPREDDNVWRRVANARKTVIYENSEKKDLNMLYMLGNGCSLRMAGCGIISSRTISKNDKITIYKDRPYNYTLSATLTSNDSKHQVNEAALKELCVEWNVQTHFTLSSIVWDKTSDGQYIVRLIMNALAAEDGNTRTETDIFVLFQKTLAYVYVKIFYV